MLDGLLCVLGKMGSASSPGKQWLMDLENHGIDGSCRLKHLLTTCSDPIATIKEFQEKNSIKAGFRL